MLSNDDFDCGGLVYIDRVELEGFKSFARRTTVQLEPGISGVVGPNGCGKSNIVDAIKWCLGEQSAKALRGQNMGDVIFNGSATEKPADFVEVSLVFNRGKSEFKGMFAGLEEVQVTRKLNRKGQSVYLLNQSKVRLKDVQLFFMDTGLYNQRYALIEQGQIGQIIEARPQQMRLLFEEAAGISHFNERRVGAEAKLHSTTENLDKVQIVVDGLQKQLNTLKRQAKKAVQYQRYKSVIRQLSLSVAVSKYVEWASERQHLATIEKEVLAKEEELEHVNRRQWSMLTQAKQSLSAKQDQSNSLQKRLQTLTQQHTEQQTTLSFQRQKVVELEQRKVVLEQELHDLETEQQTILDSQTALNQSVQVAEERMKEASQQRSLAIDAHDSATKTIRQTDKEIEAYKNKMDRARSRMAKIDGEMVAIEQRISDIEQSLLSRQQERQRLESRLQSASVELEQLSTQCLTIEAKLSESATSLQDAKVLLQQRQTTLQQAEKVVQQAQSKVQQVQRAKMVSQNIVDSTQRMIDSNQGVSSNSKSLLTDPKVKGLLLSMLVVPKDKESLLLTLLGEDAEIMVVDSQTSDTEMLQLLGRTKGRVRLLQLAKVSGEWDQASYQQQMGPLSEIEGPTLAKRALLQLLGAYGDVTGWRLLSDNEQYPIRQGVHCKGVPASIASELLHRNRTLVAEKEKLHRLSVELGQQIDHLSTFKEQSHQAKEALKIARDSVNDIQEQRRNLTEQKQRNQRQTKQLQQDIQALSKQIAEQAQNAQRSQTEITDKSNRKVSLQAEKQQLHQQISDTDTDLRFSQEQRQQQLRHASQCSKRRNEADNQCSVFGERLVQTKRRRDEVAQNLAGLHRRLATKKKEVESLERTHTSLLHSNRQLADTVLQFQQQHDTLQAEVEASISGMQQFMEYAQKMEESVQKTQKEKDAKTQERVAIQKDLDAVRSKLTVLKHEVLKNFEIRLSGLVDKLNFEKQLVFEPLSGVDVLPPQTDEEEVMCRALFVSKSEIDSLDTRSKWETSLQQIQKKISNFGQINFAAIDEIGPVEKEFESMQSQQRDLENSIQQIEDTISQLNALCTEKFLATVEAVAGHFQELYPRLVGGGSSSVEMLEPDDPLNTGISIFAQPPGKKLERLSLLSGGERAMVAIALLFSLFHVKPSPVCLMDEVDAPLDEANGERFNTMLKEMSTRSQFIVITHNKKTMEVVDTVYGVTMPTPGVSQLVSVKFA